MPNSIDVHIGNRVRLVREAFGKTQNELADSIGIEAEKIKLYETGERRIPFADLDLIATALAVPVNCFFDARSLFSSSTPHPDTRPD